jgi:hypothetical protein
MIEEDMNKLLINYDLVFLIGKPDTEHEREILFYCYCEGIIE